MKNVFIINHPVISHNLVTIRDKQYDCESFRTAMRRVSYALFLEATRFLPTKQIEIETPLCKTMHDDIDPGIEIILAPILRAGVAFCDVAQEILPTAKVQHLGMYRDEETLQPVWYYNKTFRIGEDPTKTHVLVLDPMLATGNSAYNAIKCYIDKGVPLENIVFVCLLAAPEGVKLLQDNFGDIKIITTHVDSHLNEKGYIVPGLGDAGDKIFNTRY